MIYKKSSAGTQLDGLSFGDGRIVAGSSGYEVNYFLTDHLGSIRAVVNGATGQVKEQNDYYPFGGRYDGSGSALSDNRFKYNGQYLSESGRFLSEFLSEYACINLFTGDRPSGVLVE